MKPPVIPVLQYPQDGSYHVDSTPMAYELEKRHPGGRSIILGSMINLVFEGVTGPGVGPHLLEIVLVLALTVAQRTLPAVKEEAT